jgi:hypothetical protein
VPEENFSSRRVFAGLLDFFLRERTPTLKKTDWLKIAGKKPFLAITAPGGEPLKVRTCAICSILLGWGNQRTESKRRSQERGKACMYPQQTAIAIQRSVPLAFNHSHFYTHSSLIHG